MDSYITENIKCALRLLDQLITENIALDNSNKDYNIGDSWTVHHLKKLREILSNINQYIIK
ncbi:MAG: hypothetical protein EBU90_12965 [Proteobacteria bacterium]|nr:hypothetical protein [Pseudomonadota bacterium]